MARERNPNTDILEKVVECLGPLAEDMVFIGGCATGLLLTDVAAPSVRITRDVDAISDVTTLADYYQLSAKLRERGFVEDGSEEAPICRWKLKTLTLDVMPVNPDPLGFGNEWYRPALEHAQLVTLPSSAEISHGDWALFSRYEIRSL